ncbi:hypothetical protein hmeg3_06425 [Herbaspirillum sp. meg3]|nr:hypothetical protein hmeg3_06425 [Herbaspirillum sp. meg3]
MACHAPFAVSAISADTGIAGHFFPRQCSTHEGADRDVRSATSILWSHVDAMANMSDAAQLPARWSGREFIVKMIT